MSTLLASQDETASIVRHFCERTGADLSLARRPYVAHSIRRVMDRTGVDDGPEFLHLLRCDERVFDDLVGELTVGETYFLRIPEHFEFIRSHVVPALRAKRGPGQALRAWSCACSTGEEPYSLAIVLEEEGVSDEAPILATDISRRALGLARQASYPDWSFRTTGPEIRHRYFTADGPRSQLCDRIRRRVRFRRLNLADDPFPTPQCDTWGMDLILCRNVLIYLTPEAVERACRRLLASLGPDGWLLTAPTDPPVDRFVACEAVMTPGGIVYRQRGPSAVSTGARPILATLPAGYGAGNAERSHTPAPEAPPHPPHPSTPIAKRKPARPAVAALPQPEPPAAAAPSVAHAQSLLRLGAYAPALECLAAMEPTPEVCALTVRILANTDAQRAASACADALARHAMSAELNYLRGVLFMRVGRFEQSAASLRRALYLDPSLAIAYAMLGTALAQAGRPRHAWRAYRNARALCLALGVDAPLPLAEGETAGRLADAAAAQMALLYRANKEPHP